MDYSRQLRASQVDGRGLIAQASSKDQAINVAEILIISQTALAAVVHNRFASAQTYSGHDTKLQLSVDTTCPVI